MGYGYALRVSDRYLGGCIRESTTVYILWDIEYADTQILLSADIALAMAVGVGWGSSRGVSR